MENRRNEDFQEHPDRASAHRFRCGSGSESDRHDQASHPGQCAPEHRHCGDRSAPRHPDRFTSIHPDLLPAEEKVATVFGGDTSSWVFDGGHVASRFISIKPKVANSTTDVHIVSDHGNEYTLQLREVSADADPHYGSKVFISPGDQAGKEKLVTLPVFVPAAELDRRSARQPRQRQRR